MAAQHWMKRAWFQRIRGGGCQPWSMGGKPMCCHLVLICHIPCLIQPLKCLIVDGWGSYCWVVVVVVGLSVLAHVPTPPADSSSSLAWGRRNIHFSLSTRPFWPLSIFPHARSSPSRCGLGNSDPHAERETFCFSSRTSRDSSLVCVYSEQEEWPQGHDFAVYVSSHGFLHNSGLLFVQPRFGLLLLFPCLLGMLLRV